MDNLLLNYFNSKKGKDISKIINQAWEEVLEEESLKWDKKNGYVKTEEAKTPKTKRLVKKYKTAQ